VLFIQRFDSALRLNVHAHLLSLDGVYVRAADGELRFHDLPEPTAENVAEVARRTAARLVTVLKKHGREVDPELGEVDVSADDKSEGSALSACYAAAAAANRCNGLDAPAGSALRPSPRCPGTGIH
jgi:hypothetical protein